MNPMHLALARIYEWGNCLMWSAAILSVPFWFYMIIYAVPTARIVAQQQKQNAIWHVNRFFCARYGMPPGTLEYTQCVDDLTKIRIWEDRRIAAETERLF